MKEANFTEETPSEPAEKLCPDISSETEEELHSEVPAKPTEESCSDVSPEAAQQLDSEIPSETEEELSPEVHNEEYSSDPAPEEEHPLDIIVESVLFAAGKPMTPEQIAALFPKEAAPAITEIKQALNQIEECYADRGIQLQKTASGYRFQVRQQMITWVRHLWEDKPPRYTRALLETLALIAYRQPITRGEIEEIRGVAVSSNIIRTLQEREWVRMVGHGDVPGRPAMYATTRQFLDYFNLTSLNELPPLGEIKSLDAMAENFEKTLQSDEGKEESAESNLELPLSDTNAEDQTKKEGTKQSDPEGQKSNYLLLDREKVKALQEEKEQKDQQVFSSVDDLLSSVKTDFTDYDEAKAEANSANEGDKAEQTVKE